MNELVITWQGLLFEAIAFLIFTYLLNIFLFKPIGNILKKRKEIVESHEKNGNDIKAKIEELTFKIDEERKKLKIDVHDLKIRAYAESKAEVDKIITSSKTKAVEKFKTIVEGFEGEKKSLKIELESRSKEVSELIYKKLTG